MERKPESNGMMGTIGLIDIDQTKFPNLVLMKLSAHFKAQGYDTELLRPRDILNGSNLFQSYDKLIGATVFTRNAETAKALAAQGVHVGGTGTDNPETLPDAIEHIMPDYSLYGITDTAYGFLTRGCPRECPFCIVADKEGNISRKVADLSEFWNGQKKIVLCDPNIMACRGYRINLLHQLADSGALVEFNQGVDARLLNDEIIDLLNHIRMPIVHFAWDNPRDLHTKGCLEELSKKLKHPDKSKRIVYVLVNYWSTIEEDLMRIYWLRDHDFMPFVMVYDKGNEPHEIHRMQRWCNNRWIFGRCKRFEDYWD